MDSTTMVKQNAGALSAGSTTAKRLAFEHRAIAAEAAARRDPRGYRLRVVLFALLGYAVLWVALGALLGLLGIGVWGTIANSGVLVLLIKSKIGIALLAGIAILARSLWVRLQSPTGLRLGAANFPVLHAEIERLRAAAGAPSIDELLLNGDFNAALVQTPRLGVFGWQRNSLVLGIQLLLSLSPEQCRAVIAHELGHLSGQHGRLGGWIYRIRESWRRTMVAFDQSGIRAGRLLARFFDWFAPAFAAYSFVAARANEYQADALSLRLTNPEAAAQALLRTRVLGAAIGQQYWRPLLQRAECERDPERRAFSGLQRFLVETYPDAEKLDPLLQECLHEEAGFADTHPSLCERLAALNAKPSLPGPIEQSAAASWLGARFDAVLDAFDVLWLQSNGEPWRQQFAQAEQARADLAALRAKNEAAMTREERWRLAALSERFEPEVDPLPRYLSCKAAFPDDRNSDLAIGRLLAERSDAGCLQYLESAAAASDLARTAAETAMHYLTRAGDKDAAEGWRQRAEAAYDVAAQATREREKVARDDTMIGVQLAPETLDLSTGVQN